VTVRAAVVVFPGTNCERDCARVLERLGATVELLWHTERDLHGADIALLPGGFAHGDYLRTGAIASFSPVMEAVSAHAQAGGLVIGICNGFQVLCEAGLLPGALRKNRSLRFICRWTEVRVCNASTPFTTRAVTGQRLRLPINHFEGGYYCDEQTLCSIESNDQIALRYESNPNGSLADIAGITCRDGNVLGLMPHPERACETLLGSEDGLVLLSSIVDNALRAA
jgi:phosphoribosylformylglycinamidine synthase subunit PurQ / glutaminase